MNNWWREDPHMPKYVNPLEDVHIKAVGDALLILDEWITVIVMSSILAENSFPTSQDKWEKIPVADNTCTKWKNHFVDSQSVIELAT